MDWFRTIDFMILDSADSVDFEFVIQIRTVYRIEII